MNTNGAIHALSKFYDAGFEFLMFNVGNDTDAANTLSNYFEAQDHRILVLNLTTPAGKAPDFSPLDSIKENRSTKVTSLPANYDPDSVLGSVKIGKYASRGVGANFKFMQALPGVTPQPMFTFTASDLAVYDKYNISTYAYISNVPMSTNGKSLTGFDVGALVVRDEIRQTMMDHIGSYVTNNPVTPYTDASITAIRAQEQGILGDYKNRGLIADYSLKPISTEMADEVKATGVYKDAGYTYTPIRSIDQVIISQMLNITKEE
ncbi:hypothetical protein [Apilactobacillus timberlakei]|uniref:hypothetical protein n=1 Tax=Apilactobacillus timberlakei TaxID=2008380 RepID=UPI001129EFE3|nr:hypothetical protein [Apilactobacillus timberlakei]TPR16644.1 hypothetical protein DYZ95_07320 [Apilactobacillus timberlakei]